MVHFLAAMSVRPDSAELAPSRDPAAYGRRPLTAGGFVGWLVLCAVCLAGGLAIGRFVLVPPQPPKPTAMASDELTARPAPVTPAAPNIAPPVVAPTPGLAEGADSGLAARIARLEASAVRQNQAAAAALAAASLSVAAEGAAPFDQEVAAAERLAPDDPDLRALQPLAARGAPSRPALAAVLPDISAATVVAVREPAQDAGFLTRLSALIGRVVIVRNVDPATPGVDGALARAQAQASAGDIAGAAQTLRTLPAAARPVVAEWLAAADRRVEIDRRIAAIRARALASLAEPSAGTPPA
jgi:hypothetical protein